MIFPFLRGLNNQLSFPALPVGTPSIPSGPVGKCVRDFIYPCRLLGKLKRPFVFPCRSAGKRKQLFIHPCRLSRVPELRQLSTDIDKATTAVINAKLSLESSIRQSQREEGVLGAAVNTISGKVDTIKKHIAQVMEDAPTKLRVTVTVCDDDWEKMQELHTQWMEQEKQMLADQYKQQETLWRKQSQRLTDIVRNNEGVWLSAKLFYIVGSLSLLSIITIVLEIAFYVYFHWIR